MIFIFNLIGSFSIIHDTTVSHPRVFLKPTEQRRKTSDAMVQRNIAIVASTSETVASTSSGLQSKATAHEPLVNSGSSSNEDDDGDIDIDVGIENIAPNTCSRMPMLPLLSKTVKKNIPFASRGAYRKIPDLLPMQNTQNVSTGTNTKYTTSGYILKCIQSYEQKK